MLCSVYTTIAGEYDGPPFCTPIGVVELARRFVVTKRRGNLVELVLCACIDGWKVIVRS